MTNHISDELPRLLTGDAPREVVLEAALHLRNCADCQQDLVSAVVAHASLMSAHRFAPEIVAPEEHHIKLDDDSSPGPLPDLSDMFTQVRQEAEKPTTLPRRRRALVAVAAAAAIVVGGGVTYAIVGTDDSTSAVRQVALISDSARNATATIVDSDRLKIDASSLPKLDAKHQYEVWLTVGDGSHAPQSVGYVNTDRRADLPVPSRVLSQFDGIAVSVQGLHQTEYSGQTVLHGSYS